jgi:hypothetical protein
VHKAVPAYEAKNVGPLEAKIVRLNRRMERRRNNKRGMIILQTGKIMYEVPECLCHLVLKSIKNVR